MADLINDSKIPVVVNGQTYFVTPADAEKLKKTIADSNSSVAVEAPVRPSEWQGKTLIHG